MLAKKIASLQHPQVLHWVKLAKERSYRHERGSVLIAGEKLVRELSRETKLLCLISLDEAEGIEAEQKFLVTDPILKKITGLVSPDKMAAEIALPAPQDVSSFKSLLILDQISDPGNLGALLRTAHALGWEGVAVTPGTVDLFNDKALRAAKGATFRLPYAILPQEEILGFKHPFYIADTMGKDLKEQTFGPLQALVLSNESKGPRDWPKGVRLSIPMRPGAESLNVASAGAILLYAMRPF